MNRRRPVFLLTIWCLLSLWLFFGGLELAEQLHYVPEASEDDLQDLDEEALLQLAFGLRPAAPNLDVTSFLSVATELIVPSILFLAGTLHQIDHLTGRILPSLRLHQRLSIYRI
ncbi:MAG: hypothetical protein HY581_12145 [Nitrospirae bacterium]|nr:hypothetical protein [Nitrospirota bacterium]